MSRKQYRHWGNYYALYGGIDPLIEKATNPEAFLSTLPGEVLALPLAISDHSCSGGYCNTLRDIYALYTDSTVQSELD